MGQLSSTLTITAGDLEIKFVSTWILTQLDIVHIGFFYAF